jgi:hypothetical protein
MRKTLSLLALLFLLLSATQANAQTGCHAVFGVHHSPHSLAVHFSDASTSGHAITSWLWDFGDGHTSTAQHPTHTYAHHGVYTVCLTIHDNHGCTHTSCHQINVNSHFSISHHHPVVHHQHHARIQRGDNVPMTVKPVLKQ